MELCFYQQAIFVLVSFVQASAVKFSKLEKERSSLASQITLSRKQSTHFNMLPSRELCFRDSFNE